MVIGIEIRIEMGIGINSNLNTNTNTNTNPNTNTNRLSVAELRAAVERRQMLKIIALFKINPYDLRF